jgi:hypothetical protein
MCGSSDFAASQQATNNLSVVDLGHSFATLAILVELLPLFVILVSINVTGIPLPEASKDRR